MYLDAKTQPPLSVLDTSLYPERLSDTAQEVLSILSRQTALPVIILNAPPGGGKTRTLNEIARYARRSGVFDEVVQWQPVAGDNVVSIRWMMDQLQMDFSPAASLTDRRNRLKDELIRRRYLFLVDDTSPERWQPLIELLEDTPGHLILTQTGTHPTKYLDISVPALDKTAVQQILLSYDVPALTAAQLDSLMHLTGGLPLLVHLFGSMTRQNNQTHHTFNPATFIKHYQTLDGSDHQTPDDRYTYFMAVLWDYLFPKTRQALYALSLYDAIGATREDLQALLGYEDDELQILLEQLAAFCEEDAPLRLHRVLIQQVRQWTDRYKREARSLQALERGFIRERLARLQPSQYNFEYLDQHFGHIEQALTLLQTVTIQPERLLAYVETLWNLRYYLEHRHAYDLLEGTVTTLLQALDNVDEAAVAATDDELPYARMHLLQMAAQITIRQGHYEVALTQLEDGLALCRQYGWQEAEGVMLVDMGVVYQRTADYETALDYFQQGEDCLPASVRSDIWNRLRINRTLVYRAMNETDKVSASYQDIISSGNEGGLDVHQTYTYLWALLCRGNQLFWDKSYDEAREGYLELLHAARRYQNLLYEAYALLNLGVVAVWKSEPDLEQAHFYFDEALLATGMVKSPWLKTQYLYNHGALHIIEDDIPEAVSHLYRAQDIALENESAKLDAQVRVGLGILNYRISDRSMARSYWIGSIKQAPNDLRLVARALYGHALLALQAYVAESTGQPEEDTIRDLITSHIHAYNLQSLICMTISYETFNDAIDYFCQLLGEARLRMSTGAIQREMIIRSLQSALGQ